MNPTLLLALITQTHTFDAPATEVVGQQPAPVTILSRILDTGNTSSNALLMIYDTQSFFGWTRPEHMTPEQVYAGVTTTNTANRDRIGRPDWALVWYELPFHVSQQTVSSAMRRATLAIETPIDPGTYHAVTFPFGGVVNLGGPSTPGVWYDVAGTSLDECSTSWDFTWLSATTAPWPHPLVELASRCLYDGLGSVWRGAFGTDAQGNELANNACLRSFTPLTDATGADTPRDLVASLPARAEGVSPCSSGTFPLRQNARVNVVQVPNACEFPGMYDEYRLSFHWGFGEDPSGSGELGWVCRPKEGELEQDCPVEFVPCSYTSQSEVCLDNGAQTRPSNVCDASCEFFGQASTRDLSCVYRNGSYVWSIGGLPDSSNPGWVPFTQSGQWYEDDNPCGYSGDGLNALVLPVSSFPDPQSELDQLRVRTAQALGFDPAEYEGSIFATVIRAP